MSRLLGNLLPTVLLLTTVSAASATDLYVDARNDSGTALGTKESPFPLVQAAIDAAQPGDTIRVAMGTYTENLRIQAKPIVLEGGYSSDWDRDVESNRPTLAGAGGNAVINIIECDVTVDGFRITGGTGSTEQLPYSYNGGGIYSRDGSPTIRNNIVENNDVRSTDPPSDYNLGGGIYVVNAPSATIENNVVRGNYAGRGGGIAVVGPAALIRGNTVENNVAVGDHGGGLFIAVTDAAITQNIIRGNEVGRALTYGWGGGLIFVNPGNSAEISFNVVYENFAAAYGSGEFIDEGAHADIHHELVFRNVSKEGCEAVSAIAVDGGEGVGSQANIDHCTIVNNVCENSIRGNGLQVEGLSIVHVTNSIFWNNGGDDFAVDGTSTLTVKFTDSQEAFSGEGNISANPLFADEADDDYHLKPGSPCIDAGDPAAPFDGEPGDNGGRADMGRFGNAGDEPSGSDNSDNDNAGDADNSNDNSSDNTGGTGNANANTNENAGTPDNANSNSPDNVGGSVANENSSHAGGAGGSQNDNVADPADGAVTGAALCPTAAALLFSISLIGMRRTRPVRRDHPTDR